MKVTPLCLLLVFATVSHAQVGQVLEDLDPTRPPEVRAQAEARLRTLGTNALPWLAEEMALMNGTRSDSMSRSNIPPMAIRTMRLAAREYALQCSWDAVFDRVYAGYETALGREHSV